MNPPTAAPRPDRGSTRTECARRPASLVVLSICDFQSRMAPFLLPPSLGGGVDVPVGGLARIAAAIAAVRAARPQCCVAAVLGTDPTGPLYRHLGGRAEYPGLAMAGFDVLVPGEHEVELGREHFQRSLDHAVLPMLCANLRPAGVTADLWRSSHVMDLAMGKIGLVGLSAPPVSDAADGSPCLEANADIAAAAEAEARRLRGLGCRAVLALTHMGLARDRELARCTPGIDAVLGAHSHTPTAAPVWERAPDGAWVPVVQSLGGGAALGRMEIDLDRPRTDQGRVRWQPLLLDDAAASDPAVAEHVARCLDALDAVLRRPVGVVSRPLPAAPDALAAGRAALGYVVADGIRSVAGADVSLFPAAEITPGQGLGADAVTRSDLYRLLPFGNTVWEVDVDGQTLGRLVAGALAAAQAPPATGDMKAPCFLYFSGLKVSAGPPPRVWVDREGVWRPLAPRRRYRLAVPFMLRCGARGCDALAGLPGRNLGVQEVEALSDLMAAADTVTPPRPEDRLTTA